MSTRFVCVDRDTPMLLPPDLHEWVSDNHLVKFVVEAVDATDMSGASLNVRGTGSAQYPPGMMLGLLIYCYSTGVFSSRRIERSTYDSVAVRYICANTHPDHDTIAKFRRENGDLIKRCFVQVLELARELGVLKVGTISLDGTKLSASAAKRRNQTEAQLNQAIKDLEREVHDRMAVAAASDAEDTDEGMQLPDALGAQASRRKRLADARDRLAARRKASERHPKRGCRVPVINTTDADSRLMPTRQGPFIQGYNAQAVSTEAAGGGLIVGAHVSCAPNDRQELAVAVDGIPAEVGMPEVIVVDCGYDNSGQIAAVEERTGAMVLCPPQESPVKADAQPSRYSKEHWRQQRIKKRAQMRERLASPEGRAKYRKRNISEANFALIKQGLGFTRFMLRGHRKVSLEWTLVCLAMNCRKISSRI